MTMLARAQEASRDGGGHHARYPNKGSDPKTALTHDRWAEHAEVWQSKQGNTEGD